MSVSGFAGTRPPREEVLLLGLVDWVPLERVHQAVVDADPGRPPAQTQQLTLNLIHDLASEGLFTIGDLTGEGSRFAPWAMTTEQSLQRIRDAYVDGFDNPDHWFWFCWLDLTEAGAEVAQPLEDALTAGADAATPPAPPEESPSADHR